MIDFYVLRKLKKKPINEYYEKANIDLKKIIDLLYGGEDFQKLNDYQLGNNLRLNKILGFCNIETGFIGVHEGLNGADLGRVLEHERHHREYPQDSEYITRVKTVTLDFSHNKEVSYFN